MKRNSNYVYEQFLGNKVLGQANPSLWNDL